MAIAPTVVGKHNWITEERVDKFLSSLYWTDCNLAAAEAAARRLLPSVEVKVTVASFGSDDGPRPASFAEGKAAIEAKGRRIDLESRPSFGPLYSTHWFQVDCHWGRSAAAGDAADDAQRRRLRCVLEWCTHSEGLVYDEFGTVVTGVTGEGRDFVDLSHVESTMRQLGPKRPRDEEGAISSSAARVTLYIEMACNERTGDGSPDMISPPRLNKSFTLSKCDIVAVDPVLEALRRDLGLLVDFSRKDGVPAVLADESRLAANEAVNVFDFRRPDTYLAAFVVTERFFERHRRESLEDDPLLRVTAVGHCHIDTAWLWTYGETRRKVARSWASQLHIAERRARTAALPPSGFTFVASQAVHYEWLSQDHPQLFARIQAAVRKGWFVPVGGTWVEMDGNLPGGESILRQFLIGQRVFADKFFGLTCDVFWLPDTFGYTGQLPQLSRLCGAKYFLSQKLSWNLMNKPRHTTFWWEGIDGSRVLAHFPPTDSYNCDVTVEEMLRHTVGNRDLGRSRDVLMLYGMGDGGGGPTEAMVDRLTRLGNLKALAATVVAGTPSTFFHRVEALDAQQRRLMTHVGELYFEMHRGVTTTQRSLKLWDRRGELSAILAEAVAAFASMESWLASQSDVDQLFAYPHDELTTSWKHILCNQFHDVLPGTSIEKATREAQTLYEDAARALNDIATRAIAHLAAPRGGGAMTNGAAVALIGQSPPPSLHASLPVGDAAGFSVMLCETAANGSTNTAPSSGQAIRVVSNVEPAESSACGRHVVTVTTGHYQATFGPNGRVESLLVADGRGNWLPDVVAGHLNHWVCFDDVPLFWDAWDVEVYHTQKPGTQSGQRTADVPVRIQLVDHSRCVLHVDGFPVGSASRVSLEIECTMYSPLIRITAQVDWHDTHQVLKFVQSTNLRSMTATYGVPFGAVERPTHVNTTHDEAKFETCGHGFMDLTEGGARGLGVINGSGLHGMSCRGGSMAVSVLRGATRPDPRADAGRHRVVLGLVPHRGSWQGASIDRAAHQLECDELLSNCVPLASPPSAHTASTFDSTAHRYRETIPLLTTSDPALVISSVKVAERALCRLSTPDPASATFEIIVHCFEAHGSARRARIHLRFVAWLRALHPSRGLEVASVAACDGLERSVDDAALALAELTWMPDDRGAVTVEFAARPFQVAALRIVLARKRTVAS